MENEFINNRCKKHRSTYSKSRLNSYVRCLLAAHGFLILLFIADMVSFIMSQAEIHCTCELPDFLIRMLNYKPDQDITIALLSSLLVVWTFITAIMIFYMEKKDILYCGLRTWDIVSFDIPPKTKLFSGSMFFIELFLILITFFKRFSWTIMYLLILYPTTAGCIFGFVCWATKTNTIRNRYYDMILNEYNKNSRTCSATSMERIPALTAYLNTLSSFTEKDWDLLIELLINVFVSLCLKTGETKKTDVQKTLYTIISCILNNTGDTNQKIKFLKNLTIKTYNKVKDSSEAIDILTAVSLPAAAFHNSSGYCYYTSCFSVIPSEAVSHQMLLRGIVFSVYLHTSTGSIIYFDYFTRLRNHLNTANSQSTEDWKAMQLFAYRLQQYNPRFNQMILDKYIHS